MTDTEPIFTIESMDDVAELLDAAAGYVEQMTGDARVAAELREGSQYVREEEHGE